MQRLSGGPTTDGRFHGRLRLEREAAAAGLPDRPACDTGSSAGAGVLGVLGLWWEVWGLGFGGVVGVFGGCELSN